MARWLLASVYEIAIDETRYVILQDGIVCQGAHGLEFTIPDGQDPRHWLRTVLQSVPVMTVKAEK